MISLCVYSGLQPSEYRALHVWEKSALVEQFNKEMKARKRKK